MIDAFDESDSFEPFVFQCLVDSFSDRDGAVLADGTQPRLDLVFAQQFGKYSPSEDMGLI